MPSNLRIDPQRLWATLMETAVIGGTAKGGINRQTLTADDGKVRAWFTEPREWPGKVGMRQLTQQDVLRAAWSTDCPCGQRLASSRRKKEEERRTLINMLG